VKKSMSISRPEPQAELVPIRRELILKLIDRLKEELSFYELRIEFFRRKYGCELEELDARIEREGVPPDEKGHEIWDDSIEWHNAADEARCVRELLRELEEALRKAS